MHGKAEPLFLPGFANRTAHLAISPRFIMSRVVRAFLPTNTGEETKVSAAELHGLRSLLCFSRRKPDPASRIALCVQTLLSRAILELTCRKTCLYAPFMVPSAKKPLKMR